MVSQEVDGTWTVTLLDTDLSTVVARQGGHDSRKSAEIYAGWHLNEVRLLTNPDPVAKPFPSNVEWFQARSGRWTLRWFDPANPTVVVHEQTGHPSEHSVMAHIQWHLDGVRDLSLGRTR